MKLPLHHMGGVLVGSSNAKGGGVKVLLDNGEGFVIEQSLRFNFPVSNNQAKYEACLARLATTKELGAESVTLCSDSQLLVSQVIREFQAKSQYFSHTSS